MSSHAVIDAVTDHIWKRNRDSHEAYFAGIAAMLADPDSDRRSVSRSNMAHAAAAAGTDRDGVRACQYDHVLMRHPWNMARVESGSCR